MSPVGIGIVVFLILLAVLLIVTNVKIVPQSRAYVVERLGAYRETWQTGIHLKIPFFERIARNVSLKEQVVDFPPQPVITKDNVTMRIDTVVFFQITDPKLFTYGVENPMMAIENLTSWSWIRRLPAVTRSTQRCVPHWISLLTPGVSR